MYWYFVDWLFFTVNETRCINALHNLQLHLCAGCNPRF